MLSGTLNCAYDLPGFSIRISISGLMMRYNVMYGDYSRSEELRSGLRFTALCD